MRRLPSSTLFPFPPLFRSHTYNVYSVAWSPDGKAIASGSGDNTVQVWDAATGTIQRTYTGHSDTVYSVASCPDCSDIASASSDNTLQVRNAATGTIPRTYT